MTTEPQAAQPDRGHLLRVLGVTFGVAVVVGGVIGQGILRTPGVVAEGVQNPTIIIALWCVAGLVAWIDAMSTVELAASIRKTGGPYICARRAFGSLTGLAVGVCDWLGNMGGIAFIAVVFGEYLHRLGVATSVPIGVLALLIVVVVGIGFFGVGSDQSREPLPNTDVDLAQTAERAQESAPYPVVVPAAGEEWAVRSVRFTDAEDRWEVRYSSPQRHLVTMVQAPEISAPMLSASFPGAVEGEEQEIAGVPCRMLSGGTDDEPHTGLSCAGDGWGLLIHGATEPEELRELAEAAITSID